MNIFLLISTLVALAQACPDDITKKFLEENLDSDDVCGLVNGKTFSQVWMRKEMAGRITSIDTAYTSNGHELTARVDIKGDKAATINEEWKEKEVKGTFTVTAHVRTAEGKEFDITHDVYFFFADQYVTGFYACNVKKGFWSLVIAADKDKLNDPVIQQSLNSAEQKMNTIKTKLPGSDDDKEMTKKF